jgi:mRNA interferase MazF
MEKIGIKYPRKGDVYWVALDPTIGSEIKKTRPAIIVSTNITNEISSRVIIAPVTSRAHKIFPFEVPISLNGQKGKILLDQIRSIDKKRLGKKITECDAEMLGYINDALKIVLALD